uniref:BTB domain-containing protein n=1 Tax=Panagrolaimus davidi TaxID=227884 RepID=A0A914P3K1_9BILA
MIQSKLKLTYKFDDFKELLTFIYSGKCNITNENVFVMLDMAEFYQIKDLKQLCDDFFPEMELNLTNIFDMLEISNKYSMNRMKESIQKFISQNFKPFFKSDEFLNTEKSVVTEIIALGQIFAIKYEEMFQAAYEWSENEAIKKQKELNDGNLNMNDAIKVEMQDFLPYIKFNQMEISFFEKYVVKRGFIFTSNELSDLLESVQSNVRVKITNEDGQSIYGLIPKKSSTVNVIKSLQNQCSDGPSKRIGAMRYLVYTVYYYGFFVGICTDPPDTCYLLAEMNSETDFEFTEDCKIEIV